MARNVKGITIEIGAETTKLTNALKDIDGGLKKTQSKLKDVNKLLKLDPKNTELLRQKQDALKTAIDQTSDRLKELKKAAQEATPETVGQEQYDNLQREIVDTEQKLKSLKDECKEFGSVGTQQAKVVGEQMQKVGKAVQDVGSKLTTHVTAPIVAAGGAAVAAFSEVDQGYDIVIKKTGAAGDAAQEMYDIVDNLATSIPTDFETAGEAVGEVNTRFGLTGDALEALSEQFIKFAKLNDTDVTSSVDSVQKALSAFGLGAEDAEHLLDQLNATGQATGVSVDTLTSGLIQNGTAFQELGLDIDQSVSLMGELEKSGANGETVMQGLRKALKSAAKDGKPLNEALTDLQDTIENGTDDMDGLTAAYELFGKSGDQIYGAVKNGSLDFRNLGADASDAAGSVSDTFEGTLSPMDQWTTTLNNLKLTGAALGSTIGEMLVPAIQKAGELVSSLRAAWEGLSPQQQEMIVQIAGIVAVIGPIVAIIGAIISGIGGLITSMTAIAAVFGTTIGVVAGVAAGIVALIAVIALLIMNWDKVKAKVQEVWQKASQYVGKLKEDVKSKFAQIKKDAVDKVTGMKNDIVSKLTDLKSKAIEKFNDIKAKIQEKIEGARDKVKEAIEKIKGFFDFEWKLPHIDLPHFKIEGEFSLNPPSIPHISVDWYKKAMGVPYMLDGAQIFGAMNGRLLGGGESGKEVVMGWDQMRRELGNNTYNIGITVNAAQGQNAQQIAREVARELQRSVKQKGAVWA